jgi:hypothetical protein
MVIIQLNGGSEDFDERDKTNFTKIDNSHFCVYLSIRQYI